MNMMRNPVAATALALALVAVPIRQSSPPESSTPPPDIALLEEVEGRGFWTAMACAGCVAAAGVIVGGGWGAILVAVTTEGSSFILAACIGVCIDALT